MSVVNKMLQDLESRQDQQQTPSADYVPAKKSGKGIWVILLLVILLLVAGGYWWYHENQVTVAEKAPVPEVNPTIYVPAPPSVTKSSEKKTQPSESQTETKQVLAQVQRSDTQQSEVQQQGNQSTQVNDNQSILAQIVEQETIQSAEPAAVISSFEVTTSKSPNTELALKQQIQIALQQNEDKEAIKLLKKLLNLKPENQVARKKLASLLFAQGMTSESKKIIESGIKLQPDVSEFRMMLARFYIQQNATEDAHNALRELDVSASAEPDLVSYRASLAKKLERYDLAKLDYINLLSSQPSNAKWWLGLAISEEKLGNKNSALKAYKKVKELNQLSLEVSNFVQKRIQYLAGVL